MDLYDELASSEQGQRDLASARLRERALEMLDQAMEHAQVTQAELASRLGRRRHAVNQIIHGDGNFKLSTLAEYLVALGCEVDLELFEVGELRTAKIEGRTPANVSQAPARQASGRRSIVYRSLEDPADADDEAHRLLTQALDGFAALGSGDEESSATAITVRRERHDAST